ncbi:MAG: formamidopyrimidine-DNA glycosylase, partial [Chloroflexi bacterium]|nr:formamidopyrimidine-DNA glycosylase [Chloroflexota bacterium]
PEPLDPSFVFARFKMCVTGRAKKKIKPLLMEQTCIAGIGNIYADEALFVARVRPKRVAKSLSKAESGRLHAAIRQVLLEAMGNRGSSFRDYVDAGGRQGEHQLHVRVFRRTGQPCYECGTAIKRIKVNGRSTHFCPKCQR